MKRILSEIILIICLCSNMSADSLEKYEKELMVMEDEAGRMKAEVLRLKQEISVLNGEIAGLENDIQEINREVSNILKALNLINIERKINTFIYKDVETRNIRYAEYIGSLISKYNENLSRLNSLREDYRKKAITLDLKLNKSLAEEKLLEAKIETIYKMMSDRDRSLKTKMDKSLRVLLSSQRDESSKKIETIAQEKSDKTERAEETEPFKIIWPVREGDIIKEFGTYFDAVMNLEKFSRGIVIKSRFLSEVFCVADGKVVYAGWLKGFGNTVIVEHRGGYLSVYSHLARIEVKKDEEIKATDILGFVGDTGSNEGVVLYFELRKNGKAVDPMNFLK